MANRSLIVPAGILRDSGFYEQLEEFLGDHHYVLYGDPAYPLRPLLCRPYGGTSLAEEQQTFNKRMSTVRQAVEWGFGKVSSTFAFVDFKKNQKILLQNVGGMYQAAVILTNCSACLYGNQTSLLFAVDPPSLEAYLELVDDSMHHSL